MRIIDKRSLVFRLEAEAHMKMSKASILRAEIQELGRELILLESEEKRQTNEQPSSVIKNSNVRMIQISFSAVIVWIQRNKFLKPRYSSKTY